MLYFPLILALVVWFWPAIWFRVVHSRIEVDVTLAKNALEIGEPVLIQVRVLNRSWLPCPNVSLSLELPVGLSAEANRKVYGITRSTFLLMRQEVTFDVHCYGWSRGLQDLHHREVVLRLNEGFGLKELFVRREIHGAVIVFPERLSASQSTEAMRDLNGEIERVRWLLPDEVLLRGIRSYAPGDAFKHIAWQASARSGSWMTKQFSSSTDISVGIILDGQFISPHWLGTKTELFDELCAVLRVFTEENERDRVPMYFASNAIHPGSSKKQWYGRQQAGAIKYITGAMLPYTNGDFEGMFKQCLAHMPKDAPLVIFTAFLTEAQGSLLARVAKERHLYVVAPANATLPALGGVTRSLFTSHSDDTLKSAAGAAISPNGEWFHQQREVTGV